MQRALLDTDTLSNIMRQQPSALAHANAYLSIHSCFTISLITRYEILRGLNAKQALKQLEAFERFCAFNEILPITENIVLRAATIYGELHRQGTLIGDADILIAATAVEYGLTLVTNNTNHFQRIKGLSLQNWLTS